MPTATKEASAPTLAFLMECGLPEKDAADSDAHFEAWRKKQMQSLYKEERREADEDGRKASRMIWNLLSNKMS